jgi:hypothetical protein
MNMSISNHSTLSFAFLLALASIGGGASGCTVQTDASVRPRLEVIDRTKNAFSAASITSITGTYGTACDGRSALGTDAWTLSVSGGPAGNELSVRKNDTDCVLTIDSVVTAGATFIGTPAIALDAADAYAASASAFAEDGEAVAFYGNAKVSALSFATDFTISFLASDATTASDEGDKGATFATESGSLSGGTVAASDYTIDLGSFGVAKDVNNVVQSVSGYAQLAEGSSTGQDYAVYAGALTGASTLIQVEAAWAAPVSTGSLSGLTSLQLPASGFGLSGVDLDTSPQRTIIIRNTDQGVSSYQLMLITFVP